MSGEEETYRLALENLTPGGSEFHRNPERCVEHIRKRLKDGSDAKRECVKLRALIRDIKVLVEENVAITKRLIAERNSL